MARTRLTIVLIILLTLAAGLHFIFIHRNIPPLLASAHAFTFETVTTPAAQERGLGGRAEIPDNYGMLFVFPEDTRQGFWMKDMLAPIDMIWLTEEGKVLQINDSVATSTYPETFYPSSPIRYVLETRAGEARAKGWVVGSKIELPTQ